ncbi:MAG: DegV family protein [Ktedonobacteraceae bacterium]
MAVRILTDSTADIPPALAESLGITVVPLTVFFGEEAYLDGIDMDTATFFRRLQTSKTLPRTSQPSPGAFQEEFIRLIKEGANGIIAILLSSKLSGTYQSACTARDTLPEEYKQVPIEILDSESISVGISYTTMRAAEEAKQDASLETIKAHALDRLARTRILFALDTLEYLSKGGRIGGASALVGNILSIKPILSFKEGLVVPIERPRTRTKAYARIAQLVAEVGSLESATIVESDAEVGQQLGEALKSVYKGDVPRYNFGPVIGTYSGPHVAGVAFVTAKK